MVVPFAFFSQDRHVKFLTNGRYRDIKSVNLLCITIAILNCICGRINDLCSVLLGILGSSRKQVNDLLGNQTYVDGHFTIFDCELSFFVIGLIYMKHAAVCLKLCCINAIFQGICFGYICILFFGSFCFLTGLCFCFICFCHRRHRAQHQD